MKNKIIIEFIWVPRHLGGHSNIPYEGMRTTVRWQRFTNEFSKYAIDAEWREIQFDEASQCGSFNCQFKECKNIQKDHLKSGEFVEFLSGFRVLGVGKIVEIDG